MPPDPKGSTQAENKKRRGSREAKRPAAPLASASAIITKPPNLSDDDDLSSLSEPDDSEAETERLEESPRKPLPKSVFAYTRPPPTPLKMSVELKSNKVPELVAVAEAVEPPITPRKRKRENGEVSQKESALEDKPSRPATPLPTKVPIPPDKVKKPKAVEPTQDKQTQDKQTETTPMEGIEAKPVDLPLINGDVPEAEEEPIQPDPPTVNEPAPDPEPRSEVKDAPLPVLEAEVEDEIGDGADAPREDEAGSSYIALQQSWRVWQLTLNQDAEQLHTRKAAMDALTHIEFAFAKLRDKYVDPILCAIGRQANGGAC